MDLWEQTVGTQREFDFGLRVIPVQANNALLLKICPTQGFANEGAGFGIFRMRWEREKHETNDLLLPWVCWDAYDVLFAGRFGHLSALKAVL